MRIKPQIANTEQRVVAQVLGQIDRRLAELEPPLPPQFDERARQIMERVMDLSKRSSFGR